MQLDGLDAQRRILSRSLDDYSQALQLTRSRYQGQIASELDLTRAQSQLAEAEALAPQTSPGKKPRAAAKPKAEQPPGSKAPAKSAAKSEPAKKPRAPKKPAPL